MAVPSGRVDQAAARMGRSPARSLTKRIEASRMQKGPAMVGAGPFRSQTRDVGRVRTRRQYRTGAIGQSPRWELPRTMRVGIASPAMVLVPVAGLALSAPLFVAWRQFLGVSLPGHLLRQILMCQTRIIASLSHPPFQ
jgi:hypothetical protein